MMIKEAKGQLVDTSFTTDDLLKDQNKRWEVSKFVQENGTQELCKEEYNTLSWKSASGKEGDISSVNTFCHIDIVLYIKQGKASNAKSRGKCIESAPWRPARVWQPCYMQVSQFLKWALSLAVTWRYSSWGNWDDPPVDEYLVRADCPWFPVKI